MASRRTVIARPAFRLLKLLSEEQRRRATRAIRWLEADPEPDGARKVKLPEAFPHPPGTYEATRFGIVVVYRLTDEELAIQALRDIW